MKAVFTYGRFQPPHINHGELIQKVIDIAKANNATPFIFTSQKHNNFEDLKKAKAYYNSNGYKEMLKTNKFKSTKHNENPLKPHDKLELLHLMYDDKFNDFSNPCCIVNDKVLSPFQAKYWLEERNFTDLVMIVGKDREENFKNAFNDVHVIGIDRPETTYSGTKLRIMALNDQLDELNQAMGNKLNTKQLETLVQKIKNGVTIPTNILDNSTRKKQKGGKKSRKKKK